ncbi:MAG: hypothetical protein ABEK59_07640 [Halobacteria archaeon]
MTVCRGDRLTEPDVLAATKTELFSSDAETGYVVTDTQFAQTYWNDDEPIDKETKTTLSPFNHVSVGSGYPDLVGVEKLEPRYLACEPPEREPPFVVVEAKGYSQGTVDVEGGLFQAYDRLHEANIAYVSAPREGVNNSHRTLARELNIGILGVNRDGGLEVLERPRIVGNRVSREATAIRFQAGAQGVADKSFGLNHPKNYLAVPIAHHHTGDTEDLIQDYVVGAVDDAVRGAIFLGLVEKHGEGLRLTPMGREVVRFSQRRYSSLIRSLEEFRDWQGSRKRFVDVAPLWGEVARRVVFEYPATELLVTKLQEMSNDGVGSPSLVEFVERLHRSHPTFTVELFIRGDTGVRERVLSEDGGLVTCELRDGDVYHSPTVFQLKAMLFHSGVLTERGREPDKLDPCSDVWCLRESL